MRPDVSNYAAAAAAAVEVEEARDEFAPTTRQSTSHVEDDMKRQPVQATDMPSHLVHTQQLS